MLLLRLGSLFSCFPPFGSRDELFVVVRSYSIYPFTGTHSGSKTETSAWSLAITLGSLGCPRKGHRCSLTVQGQNQQASLLNAESVFSFAAERTVCIHMIFNLELKAEIFFGFVFFVLSSVWVSNKRAKQFTLNSSHW